MNTIQSNLHRPRRRLRRGRATSARVRWCWLVRAPLLEGTAELEAATLNHLADTVYTEHGVFHRGEQATSKLLEGLSVNVDEVLDKK